MKTELKTVDEYIKTFPKDVQLHLKEIRSIIKSEAPQAVENISYGMPAYKSNGKPLVYFAAFKEHIGFYATPTGHVNFAKELSKYKQGKGSVQFPLDKPIPFDLIKKMVIFKVKENASKPLKQKVKAIEINDSKSVTEFIKKLEPELAKLVEAIRQVILKADKEIGEQIKWNSPSFFYQGEMKPFNPKEYKRDIVVLNIRKGFALLVFPTGARIADKTGLLEGDYADGRRLAYFRNMNDIKKNGKVLQSLIKQWISKVDK